MLIITDAPQDLDDVAEADRASSTSRNRRSRSKRKIVQTEPRHRARARRAVGHQRPRRAGPRQHDRRSRSRTTARVGGRVTQQGPVTQGAERSARRRRRETHGHGGQPAGDRRDVARSASRSARSTARSTSTWRSRRSSTKGKVKILSTPRVTTQNNKQAEVTQGFQIPFQTVAEQHGHRARSRTPRSSCTVTPQITGANTVIMKIVLENGSPDFSRAVNGNPSINTQRAKTQVQVADGVTTVIGGIVQSTETNAKDPTPGRRQDSAARLALQAHANANESQELLIFITPRIIRVRHDHATLQARSAHGDARCRGTRRWCARRVCRCGGLHAGPDSRAPSSSYLIVDSLQARVRREADQVRRHARVGRPTSSSRRQRRTCVPTIFSDSGR